MTSIEQLIDTFEQNLLAVDRQGSQNTLLESRKRFQDVEVLDKIITPVLERIGNKWETGTAALSQVYMSGIICEELINTIFPQKDSSKSHFPPIAVVTFEDYHVLGKRMVLTILKANGFHVMDYGQGVQADALVQKVKNDNIKILLISTLMFPSSLRIKTVREKLDALGLKIKIGVGGAPFRFDENLWKQVGADAMGRTAAEAVGITQKFVEELS